MVYLNISENNDYEFIIPVKDKTTKELVDITGWTAFMAIKHPYDLSKDDEDALFVTELENIETGFKLIIPKEDIPDVGNYMSDIRFIVNDKEFNSVKFGIIVSRIETYTNGN